MSKNKQSDISVTERVFFQFSYHNMLGTTAKRQSFRDVCPARIEWSRAASRLSLGIYKLSIAIVFLWDVVMNVSWIRWEVDLNVIWIQAMR